MSLFIVFEGCDGSGNTTQSKLLAEFLRGRVYDVLLTKEPTNGAIGKVIRDVLQKKVKTSPLALQMFFVADRAYHLQTEIEPALEEGKIVISDRYMFSTMAFGGLDVDMDFLKQINSKFRVPDITFVIDASPEVAMERIRKREAAKQKSGLVKLEHFEELEKLRRVRENYLKIAKLYPNVHVVDGNRPIEAVAAEVQKIVLGKLK